MSGATEHNTPDIDSRVRQVVAAALDRKAGDLRVLYLGEVSDFTEYFLVCSGGNQRQVQAIADGILRKLRDHKVRPLGVEGYNHGRWILIDFGSFIAHIFDEQTRGVYKLEKLWADGTDVTGTFGS